MSRCATLALILSVAACEHAQPMPPNEPTPAPSTVELAPAEPAPAAAPVAPKPAPTATPKPTPSRVAQPSATPPPPKLVRKCNPMSRAACRWQEDIDEREQSRVTKKPAAEGTTP